MYNILSEIALKYAFECSNGCPNIDTKPGCLEDLSSRIYVIKSVVPKTKMNSRLYTAIKMTLRSEVLPERMGQQLISGLLVMTSPERRVLYLLCLTNKNLQTL